MDPSKFRSLLNSPESATLAGFEVADSIAIAETYCAMSNSDGGQIMVGVRREEAVYGRPDWTPIGILAEEEPGQIIRKLESQIDKKGVSISFDLVALTQGDRNTPERTVLIIVAKKIGNPKNRMSVNGGKVFLRRGTQNIAETALERIERGKSMFRPEQFRTGPASNPEISAESQPLIAHAGVPSQGVADGVYGNVNNWNEESGPESLPDQTFETLSDGQPVPHDDGDIRNSLVSSDYRDGLKLGGEAKTSFTPSHEGVEGISDPDRSSSDAHGTDKAPSDLEENVFNQVERADQPAISAPARLLFGTQLQISRESSESEEALNCEEHAKVLAAFFDTTTDDVCFGLFGHWGRGKTYLINKVSGILRREFNYEVIRFSAWKYRSTPEVWAHLYETAAASMRSFKEPFRSLPLTKILFPYRAMLARYGIWPVILAYLTLGLSLDTLQDRFRSIEFLLAFLGFTGTLYFSLLFIRLQGFWRTQGSSLTKQPSHREKLGLQMAIGDDLRSLLIGWLPKDYWRQHGKYSSPDRTSPKWAERIMGFFNWLDYKLSLALPILLYFFVITFVFFQLAPEADKTIDLWYFGRIEAGFSQPIIKLVYAAWALVSLGVPLLALFWAQGPRQVLLVIDDLDRCEPAQMLEIMESVMLLLDDKEIQRRMQIVMLVEEEALRTALLEKYVNLRSRDPSNQQFEKTVDDCIVRENFEKLFVSYLRLPELPPADFRGLLYKYIEENDGTPDDNIAVELELEIDLRSGVRFAPITAVASDAGLESSFGDSAEESSKPTSRGEGTKPTIEYAQDLKLSRRERRLLTYRLETLRTSNRRNIRWGPRTVRSYLHKYRLARALWIALGSGADLDAKALIDELMPIEGSQNATSDGLLKYIVAQVK